MQSLSIHPRNWYLVDRQYKKGAKQNTMKPRRERTKKEA